MSTEEETLQVSVLPYRCSICPPYCVCLGCCAAEFRSFGETYELPCIVGTVTRLRVGRSGVRMPVGATDFFFYFLQKHPYKHWVSPNLLFNRYRGCLPGINRPRCDVDHSLPFIAEVKNAWIYTSTLALFLHVA